MQSKISVDVVDTFIEKERRIRCKITLHRLKIIVPRVLHLFLSFPARPPISSLFYFYSISLVSSLFYFQLSRT